MSQLEAILDSQIAAEIAAAAEEAFTNDCQLNRTELDFYNVSKEDLADERLADCTFATWLQVIWLDRASFLLNEPHLDELQQQINEHEDLSEIYDLPVNALHRQALLEEAVALEHDIEATQERGQRVPVYFFQVLLNAYREVVLATFFGDHERDHFDAQ